MRVYEVNLSINGITELKNKIQKIKTTILGNEFIEYLEMKCFEALQKVTTERLNKDEEGLYTHTYRTNHQHTHEGDTITLWNETMVDLDNLNLSEETRVRYSNGLSLAKIVEYGTGVVGANSEASKYTDDWKYMTNPDRNYNNPWVYKGEDGQLHWTRGIEGRLVFYNTKKEIEEHFSEWVLDYIDNQM